MEAQRKVYIDNYEVLRTLGEGFCGQVYLGNDLTTNEMVALKILNKNHDKAQQIKASIICESTYLQQIQHPNIIKLIKFSDKAKIKVNDQVVSENNVYMSLELAPKKEIFDVLNDTGKFDENLTRWYGRQLIEVIQFLHEQDFVHRDLKPENILLGEKYELKLIDFGFSQFLEEGQINQTNLGTPGYKSPQILEEKYYSAKKADVFAFGVILFIFAKRHPPFEKANINTDSHYKKFIYNPNQYWDMYDQSKDIGNDLRTLLQGCLALNESERYTVEQILESDFMKKDIDQQKAIDDMKQRFDAINQAHVMEIEQQDEVNEDQQHYRSRLECQCDDDNEFYISKDFINKIAIKNNVEGCKVSLKVDSNDKQQLIKKILQSLQTLQQEYDIQHNLDEKNKRIEVNIQKDEDEYQWYIEIIQATSQQLGFSVLLKQGNYFESLQIKKLFLDNFKKYCVVTKKED